MKFRIVTISDRELFGERLKIKRIDAGFKQLDIALKVGLSQCQYSRIETGKAWPSFEVFTSLCSILNVSPSFLLDWRAR